MLPLAHPTPRPRGRRWLIVVLGLVLALWVTPVAALERITGDDVGLAAGQTVDDDLVIAGANVTIGGRVTGDLFAVGSIVTLLPSARVDGDVFAAGNAVTLGGSVGGSVRAAGSTVQITGTVGRNVLTAGSQIALAPTGDVKGNWLAAAALLTLQGPVSGSVTAGAEAVQLAAPVGRDAELYVGRLTILPSARIGGDLTYTTAAAQAVPLGTVQGSVQHLLPPERPQAAPRGPELPVGVFSLLLLGGAIVVGLLLAWLVPGLYEASGRVVARRAPAALGVGLVTLIVVPVAAVILTVTILGLPLALLGLGAYAMSWYLGWILAATALAGLAVGRLRAGRTLATGWLVVIGLVSLQALMLIPFLGALIAVAVVCLGLGTVVLLIAERLRRPASGQPIAVPVPPVAPTPAPA